MASHRRTRLKLLIDEYFFVLALVLVVIAAGGAWATYTTAVAPGSHVEQRTVASWETSGEFNYSAAVVNATPISDRGTVRAGRKFYFTNAMPVLDGRFGFGFEGTTGSATVTTRTTLVNYAVHTQSGSRGPSGIGGRSVVRNQSSGQGQSGTRMWEITTPLKTERQRIEAGETAHTTFSIDISDIRERVRSIDRSLGPISRVSDARTAVAVSVVLNGTIGGERVQRSFNYTLPVNTSTGYYVVYPPQKPDTQQFDVTRRVTVLNDYGILVILASFVGLLVPLVGLAGLFYGRENDWFDVSQTTRTDVQRAKLRAEFEEWVTTGTVAGDGDRTTVTVDSLEGLVDVAIDSDRRVIEDDETGAYIVLDNDVLYRFTPDWEAIADAETTPDAEFEPDTSVDDGTTTTEVASVKSDDGDAEDTQPTAVVELSGPMREPENENENDERTTDSAGVLDQLQSAVESTLGQSDATQADSGDAETTDESDESDMSASANEDDEQQHGD